MQFKSPDNSKLFTCHINVHMIYLVISLVVRVEIPDTGDHDFHHLLT